MIDDGFPPPLSPAAAADLRRRQRGRNLALVAFLLCLAALLYAISMVRFKVS